MPAKKWCGTSAASPQSGGNEREREKESRHGGRAPAGGKAPKLRGRAPRWPSCPPTNVVRCRRPRHSEGSQSGQIGWRLGRRAALGRQHNWNVLERGALTQRDALVCRAYRRQAIGVVGPVQPHHHEREAREVADRGVLQK